MMPGTHSTVTRFFILGFCLVGVFGFQVFYYGSVGSVSWGAAAESEITGVEDCYSAYDISKPRDSDDAADEEEEYIMKDIVGTLSVNFPEMKLLDSRYWIYVDGQIQTAILSPGSALARLKEKDGFSWVDHQGEAARMSNDYVITYIRNDAIRDKLYKRLDYVLIPGEYLVELAVESRLVHESDRAENSPFTFCKHKVKIEAGKTTNLNLNVPRMLTKTPVWPETVAPAPQERSQLEEWYNGIYERVKNRIPELEKQYRNDRLVIALINCFNALLYRPPIYGNVYIDLPGEYGGSRYFDAAQVRIMVSFLKDKYASWPVWLPQRFLVLRDIDEKYYQLRDQYSKFLESFNFDWLDEIAEKLEKIEN